MKIIQIISVYDKDREGNPLRTKKGDQYRKATVKFDGDERMIGIFLWDNSTLQVGDEFDGTIESQESNGKTYFTFKGTKRVDKNAEEIAQLKFSLANTNRKLDEIVTYLKEKPWLKVPPVETTSDGRPMPTI